MLRIDLGVAVLTTMLTEQYMGGWHQEWYSFKNRLVEHFSCSSTRNGGQFHLRSLQHQLKEKHRTDRNIRVNVHLVAAGIEICKIKSAGMSYEWLIAFLSFCQADAGNIGHGRNQFPDIIKAAYIYVLKQTRLYMHVPLSSTGLPPHFSVAIDKSTPHRDTNHAIMIIVQVNGRRIAMPIDAPLVYGYEEDEDGANVELQGGSGIDLAEQVVAVLKTTLQLTTDDMQFLREDGDDECEETKYQVRGQDYAIDLCGMIYIMKPGVTLMIKCQALSIPPWKIVAWFPKVMTTISMIEDELGQLKNAEVLTPNKDLLPKLSTHWEELTKEKIEDCTFQGITVYPGWLVVDERNEVNEDTSKDCLEDLLQLSQQLRVLLTTRYDEIVTDSIKEMECIFDIKSLVRQLCIFFFENGRIKVSCEGKELWDLRGKTKFAKFYRYICKLPHVAKLLDEQPMLDLMPHNSDTVLGRFKKTVMAMMWHGLGNCASRMFVDNDNEPITAFEKHQLISASISDLPSIDQWFLLKFSSGQIVKARINEEFVFTSMYENEDVVNSLGKEFCIALDVALAVSGCEAIVEGFYILVSAHKKSGGDDSHSLPKHRLPVFGDVRERAFSKYDVSKVVDRMKNEHPRYPHPENIVLKSKGFREIKLVDFGLACGASPFLGDNDSETYQNITTCDYEFDNEFFSNITKNAQDFIRALLLKKGSERNTFEDCLKHPWIACEDAHINYPVSPCQFIGVEELDSSVSIQDVPSLDSSLCENHSKQLLASTGAIDVEESKEDSFEATVSFEDYEIIDHADDSDYSNKTEVSRLTIAKENRIVDENMNQGKEEIENNVEKANSKESKSIETISNLRRLSNATSKVTTVISSGKITESNEEDGKTYLSVSNFEKMKRQSMAGINWEDNIMPDYLDETHDRSLKGAAAIL
eukprot:gene3887-4431_t